MAPHEGGGERMEGGGYRTRQGTSMGVRAQVGRPGRFHEPGEDVVGVAGDLGGFERRKRGVSGLRTQ